MTDDPDGTVEPVGPPPEVVRTRHGMFGSAGSGDTSGYGRITRPVTMPGPGDEPMPDGYDGVLTRLRTALDEHQGAPPFAEAVRSVVVHRGEVTLRVPRQHVVAVARLLRDDPSLRFEMCLGTSGVHFPEDTGAELRAVTHLQSITWGRRLRLETHCPQADPHIPSLISVYPTVDWHERETFDFFGIVFDGHPSLTRIEMPDDWDGHPQRKDYPLGGIGVEFLGAQVAPPDSRRSYS
ncbi:NADH-quinone oxidoreductase subunit C OS=Tsukamurella paurometabola (strain ATCC 8368 / DSM/ CCUG 35730 / CIP 100753 / JCM 10117 / KCTC 9821 / NBRC 16120/ NCIMB 702349 / NCTC 13040) OX=521096 GN=nuoC PE=3 SV=1 [Tsukamurella paurometabola]|uniref:NADH-quinone oxidoreductase subunit C n=1 Tax=Tsukamurella paurometabola (strain ATCC 8368 / DSM 20162 / CCUG 35730 / CIP 100753 / JCM 10117 / KCTC 9821 / NBRC 16120 / NCIMB 702349 / NCTC 13040) TaxID=521096 RepID=D5UVH5_TSUPD|nr:NADH-quinone oxidoreductase subunit C [Tsukamurella paurometabola]ADG79757.1 NADH (or F420H2) dehydrogenase, subunit C [Tsukamurella paurometabola DSM 20162]SUP37081.1 NADH-quinone oxidoreductase chain 5 [Tsukamurella paurometabola]